MTAPDGGPVPLPEVGLCSACRFASSQRSAKGSRFWRCLRADSDPGYARYPRLPVRACKGFHRLATFGGPERSAREERRES